MIFSTISSVIPFGVVVNALSVERTGAYIEYLCEIGTICTGRSKHFASLKAYIGEKVWRLIEKC